MTTQELKKYLSMVVDMEKSIYMQERLLKRLNDEKNRLGIRREINRPIMPSQPQKQFSGCGLSLFLVIAGFVLWFIIDGLIVGSGGLSLLGLVMIIAGVVVSFASGDKTNANKKAEQNYQSAMKEYREQVSVYNAQTAEQEKRVESEATKKIVLEAQQRQVEREIIKSRDVLSKLYSYNIIYPKYRKLEFVCSLYEYLCAGRCTSLEGHEGGYNILEQEIRLDHIISQVDRVINNLNSIKYSQAQLYNAVMDSNQKLDRLISSTEHMANQVSYLGNQASTINSRLTDLQKSSDLTAYYTERNSKHLEYMNWMNYRSGMYQNAGYYNGPPSY